MKSTVSVEEEICMACGLCCNGVIFADVRLQRGDDPEALRRLGVPSVAVRTRNAENICRKVNQPCAAFDGVCRVYQDRPKYCREFDCALLKSVQKGLSPEAAKKIIRTAQRRGERVQKLLRELGDADEKLSLGKRFRRLQRRIESESPDEDTADLYGQLTMAVHELNFLISQAFYPGAE